MHPMHPNPKFKRGDFITWKTQGVKLVIDIFWIGPEQFYRVLEYSGINGPFEMEFSVNFIDSVYCLEA